MKADGVNRSVQPMPGDRCTFSRWPSGPAWLASSFSRLQRGQRAALFVIGAGLLALLFISLDGPEYYLQDLKRVCAVLYISVGAGILAWAAVRIGSVLQRLPFSKAGALLLAGGAMLIWVSPQLVFWEELMVHLRIFGGVQIITRSGRIGGIGGARWIAVFGIIGWALMMIGTYVLINWHRPTKRPKLRSG